MKVDLEKLRGKHMLSGVGTTRYEDEWNGRDIDGRLFCIDDVTYCAYIDPDDGFRSYGVFAPVSGDEKCQYTFPPQEVIIEPVEIKEYDDEYMDKTDVKYLVMKDAKNSKEIIKVGTDYSDDYYPYAIFQYHPENMSINDTQKLKEQYKMKEKNLIREWRFTDWGYMPDIEDWPLVNTKEDAGMRPTLYKVCLWCGSGYVLNCFRAWSNQDDVQSALEAVVAYLDQQGDNSLFLDDAVERDMEDIRKQCEEEGITDEEEIWNRIDDEINDWAYYCDATMAGASKPHYIYSENLRIEEFPKEYIEKGAGEQKQDDTDEQSENVKHVKMTRENLNKMIARSTSIAITENYDKIKDLPKSQQIAIIVKEAKKHMVTEGTNNFFIINSVNYNVVDTDQYTEKDEVTGEEMEVDWDWIVDDIHDTLLSAGFENDQEDYTLGRKYSYGYSVTSLEASLPIDLGDRTASLLALLCGGYYDGATIDYDIRIADNWLSEYDGLEDFVDDNMYEIDHKLDNNDENLPEDEWMDAMKAAKQAVISKLEEGIAKFNEAIKPCTVAYKKAWQGSNGEAGYTKIETEGVQQEGTDTPHDADDAENQPHDDTTATLSEVLGSFGWSFHDGYVADDGKIVYVLNADNGNESNFEEVKQALIKQFGNEVKFGTRTAKQAPEIKYHLIAVPA